MCDDAEREKEDRLWSVLGLVVFGFISRKLVVVGYAFSDWLTTLLQRENTWLFSWVSWASVRRSVSQLDITTTVVRWWLDISWGLSPLTAISLSVNVFNLLCCTACWVLGAPAIALLCGRARWTTLHKVRHAQLLTKNPFIYIITDFVVYCIALDCFVR